MSSKWNPFNAVAPGGMMVKDIMSEKEKIEKPILSEDQMMNLQEKIVESYNNQEFIKIKYFNGGRMYFTEGIIVKIDADAHKIVLNSGFAVFFSQIVEIS